MGFRHRLGVIVFATLGWASASTAQPAALEAMATKGQFTAKERLDIADWVADRAGAYRRITREADRERILGEVMKLYGLEGATAAFRGVVGDAAGRAFRPLVAAPDFTLAHPIAVFLHRIPEVGTREAYIEALSSQLPAVRYQGAKGLKVLQPKLVAAKTAKDAIDALGTAAASETDGLVREMILEALDYSSAGQGFDGQAEVAGALLSAARARIVDLDAGRALGAEDARLVEVIGATHKGLSPNDRQRADLVGVTAMILKSAVARYDQLGPSGGAVLAEPVRRIESALSEMVRETDGAGSPPSDKLAEKIAAKAPAPDVRQILDEWIGRDGKPGVLNGAPWNLPAGL